MPHGGGNAGQAHAVYAWALLGESVGPVQMLGGLVVLAGIYLAKRAS
ncbi:MAG: hypothetical protein AAB150_09535 [Pseudomonadota bacterium]